MEHSRVRGGQQEQQSKLWTDKKEAVQEESEYAELQGESLLDSKSAVREFSHAVLARRWGIYNLAFITCDNYQIYKFPCRDCICPYSGIHPLAVIHIQY